MRGALSRRKDMLMSAKNRAVIYARYSSDLQKDRSIEDQFAICRTLAQRENLDVLQEYADRAKSGATLFDRESLIELMGHAKERRFDVLVVESLDRLSRDQEDLAGMFKRLTFYGVEIRTHNEGATTPMHIGIRGLVGSMFLADLGAKVKRGQGGRVREGKFPGSVTYGYRAVPGKPGEREIDPEQAEIVRRIFREYIAGKTTRKIATDLNRDGIRSPGGTLWNHVYIGLNQSKNGTGMLINPLYRGELTWNQARAVINPDTGKKLKRAAEEADIMRTAVPHLRIIDDETWNAAQAMRKAKAPTRSPTTGKVI